jgi:hypothetical protein
LANNVFYDTLPLIFLALLLWPGSRRRLPASGPRPALDTPETAGAAR